MKISTKTTTTSCVFCAQTKTSFSETSTKEYTKRGFNHFLKTFALALVMLVVGIGSSWGQINYSFNFNNNSTDWTGNFTRFTGSTACGGTGGAMRRNLYSGATSGNLISPTTGTSNGASATVSYTYKAAAWSANTTAVSNWGNFQVQYGATATGPWTTFATVTNEAQLGNACISKSHTVTLPAGATFIRFNAAWTSGDYYLNFDNLSVVQTAASACTGTPNTPSISGATSACSGVNFTLSSAGTSAGTGITYQWQHSTDAGASWADVSGATATSLTTNATVNKQFRLVTTCSGSGSSSTSAAYAVNITAFVACTCGAYSLVTASDPFDTEISSVTVGSMTNASNTCTAAAPGSGSIAGRYANFAGIIAGPTAVQGNSVPLTVVQGSCGTSNYVNIIQIYVDWDQNGAFTNAERVYESTSGNNTAPGVSGSFTVPTTALVGTTRMRIVVVEEGTAGINYTNTSWPAPWGGSYGETEDYCFTVTAPVPPTISSVPASACPGSTVTISGSDFMSITAVTFGGVPATSFTVVNATTIQAVLSAPGAVVVTNAYGSATSSGNITFSEPALAAPVTNVSSVSEQFGQAVTIFVVAPSSSVTYNWYTSANPTFAFATDTIATTFACSNISVAAVLPGGVCESPRTMVSVTISSYPQIISSEDVFCGTGGGFSLTAEPISASATTTWQSLTPSAVLSSTTANPTSTTISETSDFMLTVSAPGCQDYTVYKSIGVYPLPTAVVTTSATGVCPGTSATINSGLSAGNFTVQAVPYAATAAPASAGVLMNNGVATTPLSGGSLDDGGWANVPIGFSFNYFGTSFSTIAAGTNGLLMFGTVPGYGVANGQLGQYTFNTTGGVFPNVNNPGNVIALMATDIHTGTNTTNGSIKYWTEGYAPNRKFVIEYKNVYGYFSNPQATVQCRLFETQGIVEIHIFEKTFNNSSTVGLQDGSKTIGAVAPGRQSFTGSITTPEAWRFAPPSDFTTIWTANGDMLISGTNVFTQTVTPTVTTLYDISYTNQTTGCASEPGSAQVNMVVLTPTPVTGVTTTSTVSQVCAGSSVPLSNDYTVSSAGLTYSWQTSIDGGTTWLDVVGATAATYSAIQNVASSYRIGISSCGGEISYATPVAIAMSSFVDCYCTPSGGSIYDEEITNVTISTLNNSSTCTDPAPGAGSITAVYGNYAGLPATNLIQTVPVSGSLTIGTCGTFNYTSGAAIFIDYNHNGSFSDAGERVWSNGSSANINCLPASVVPVSFTAPLSSLPGLTRMRIINSEGYSGAAIDPCVTPNYGEVEDYIVNVVGPPDAPATPIATNGGSCILGDTISMVGTPPAGVAYYWQTTANGTSFDNSASTWVVNGNGTYYIRAYASLGGLWSAVTSITLSAFPLVTPPIEIINLSGNPYCAAVTLQAGTAPLGITYYWQGTNLTGTSIALPAAVNSTATASGTYYIAARNDTTLCWSATTSINLVVFPAPTGTAVASSPASCVTLDGSVLFSVSGAGNYEYSLTDSTWATTNPISAAPGTYNASVRYAGVGGCVVSLGSVTISPFSMNSVSISRADSLACSGEVMTVNGTVVGQAAGLTYQWQISTDNGTTWGNIAGATNINVSNPQTAASLYRLGVSYCGGEYAYTSSVSIAMDNIQNCFCIPAPTAGTSDGDLISLVSIVGTTLNNNTGFVNGTPAYMFYNSLPNHTATLMPSTTYTMSVATGEWGNQGMAAWIDYNDDGVFSATERIGATPGLIGSGVTFGQINATGSFTIALACAPPAGIHRLRVRTVYGTAGVLLSPCTNYQWGETEDYMVTIAPAPACPNAGLLSTNLNTPISSTSADFEWEQGCSSATSYDIEYGPTGFTLGSGTLVANQTVTITGTVASYTLQGLASASTYDVYVRAHCDSVNFSAWSNVIAASTASSGPATSPQTFCQGATVANLVATGSAGSTIYWYSSATETVWLSAGVVLSSGTYYASQVVGGVESSDRTPTSVTILPNTSVTTPVTACATYTWADNGQTYTASGIYSGSVTNCVTQILDLTITPLAIPTVAVSASPAGPVCVGTSVTFTATTANAGVSPSACDYTFNLLDSWGDGWNGNTMSVLQGSTVVATLSFAADENCYPCTANSLSQTVSLQSGQTYTLFWNPTPTSGTYPGEVGINVVNPSGTTIYSMPFFSQALKGTTLTTINANCSTSTIAWQVNGVAVAGANASTYTTSSLNPGDVVTASIAANSPCVSSTAVVSSPSTLVVNPLTTPTVAVTSSSSSVCQGTAVTFTAAGSPANVAVAASCNYTFNMLDSYGDGWNGAQMRVMNGTTVVATLTGPANSYPSPGFLSQTVSLQSGISYSLVWNSAGSYDEEVGVQVVNSSGVTVYSMGYNSWALAGTTLTTIAADCPSVSPYQWSLNGSPIAGATSATYTSSALSSTDVVTVSYTTNAPCTSTAPAVSSGVSVNVIANTVNTTTASAYVSYSWNGQTYTASGVYTGATTNCVTEQLNLTILTMPLVTFQVDMAQSNAPAGAIPYVNGTFNGWCGNCNPMTNIGGSVWSLTIPLMPQTYEYKFTYNGWDGAENLLAGTSCTVTNFGFTNRFLVLGTANVVLPLVCWNQCSACVTQAPVTFRVDMSQSGAPAGSIPEVNGTFNGWCGNCNPMTDANGDGVWETTILLAEGPYEYKFSYSNWSGQESLTPGSSCTLTSGQFTNRTLAVAGSQAMLLPVVCWNSCSACVITPSLSLNVFLDGYYQNGSNPATMVAARYLNLVEAGSATPGAVTDVDLITVQLRSATNTETIVHTATPMLQKNGSAYCEFPLSALGGSYYVVVDHKASNPLWSANPITLTTSSTYNFTNNLVNAYSDGDPLLSPMHTIVSGLYGIWLGELNEDGYLDANDFSNLEMDIYASGYQGLYLLDGDFNGDTYVDASDFAVFDSNSNYGAYEQRP